MNLEQRVDRIEEAILIMKDLVVSHDERLENYFRALQESHEDFNFKLNALTDAQMRNETEIQESREDFNFKLNSSAEDFNFKLNALIDLQMSNEVEIRELKDSSKLQLKRIEKLENK